MYDSSSSAETSGAVWRVRLRRRPLTSALYATSAPCTPRNSAASTTGSSMMAVNFCTYVRSGLRHSGVTTSMLRLKAERIWNRFLSAGGHGTLADAKMATTCA